MSTFRNVEFPCRITAGDILCVEGSDCYEGSLYVAICRDGVERETELDIILSRAQAIELAKRITEYYGQTAPMEWTDR